MKTASTLLLIASALAALAAIWHPIGSWWQWLATAVILLLAGAGTGAAADKNKHPIDEPGLMPEHVADELIRDPEKPTYGLPDASADGDDGQKPH